MEPSANQYKYPQFGKAGYVFGFRTRYLLSNRFVMTVVDCVTRLAVTVGKTPTKCRAVEPKQDPASLAGRQANLTWTMIVHIIIQQFVYEDIFHVWYTH